MVRISFGKLHCSTTRTFSSCECKLTIENVIVSTSKRNFRLIFAIPFWVCATDTHATQSLSSSASIKPRKHLMNLQKIIDTQSRRGVQAREKPKLNTLANSKSITRPFEDKIKLNRILEKSISIRASTVPLPIFCQLPFDMVCHREVHANTRTTWNAKSLSKKKENKLNLMRLWFVIEQRLDEFRSKHNRIAMRKRTKWNKKISNWELWR